MPSFDIFSEANKVEVKNAMENANKEINNRFDFKGTDSRVEQTDDNLNLFATNEFQLAQVKEIVLSKMSKRNVDFRFLEFQKVEKITGDKVKQLIIIKNGIDKNIAKKIQKIIKNEKLKVQSTLQGSSLRVTSTKKDVLQDIISIIKKEIKEVPIEFRNFRN